MQTNPDQPGTMEAVGAFTKDPLNEVLKEFAYAVVFRDMQINVLRTRLAQLEKAYADLKENNLRLQQEQEQSAKNGQDSQEELKRLEDALNEHSSQ
jgi:uncharacterized protein involved in exopolysaccharide biosynthesis